MGIPPIDLQERVMDIWEIDQIELKVKETIHRIKKSFIRPPLDFINENDILTYNVVCLLDKEDFEHLFINDIDKAETEFFYLCEYLRIRYPKYNFYIYQQQADNEWHLVIQKINEETEHLLWKNSLPRVN